MSNKQSAQNSDMAPVMRKAFLESIKVIQRRTGKKFPEIMADWLEENPATMLNAISKFAVREHTVKGNIDHVHTHEVKEAIDFSAIQKRRLTVIEGKKAG